LDYLISITLGIVQGLTEFLPVSSSGHLVLASHFFGYEDQESAFEIILHFGTLLSVIIYFRYDIYYLLKETLFNFFPFIKYAFLGLKRNVDKEKIYSPYYSYFIVIASMPAAYVGLTYKDDIEQLFRNPLVAIICLFVTGLIMLVSRFAKERNKSLGSFQAFLIGIAQAIAILPGISRSGSTIVTGLFLGIKKEFVAKFSFLMSVPVIFGAFILKLNDLFAAHISTEQWISYGIGTLAAAISGYFAIMLVMTSVQKGKFEYFGYYCIFVSILSFLFYS
jgi:undecaprenyl-diphosphatase